MGYSPWGHKESDTTERLSNNKKSENGLRARGSHHHAELRGH